MRMSAILVLWMVDGKDNVTVKRNIAHLSSECNRADGLEGSPAKVSVFSTAQPLDCPTFEDMICSLLDTY